MKKLSVMMLLFFTSSAFAEVSCLDTRLVRFASCPAGQTRVYVQGACPKSYLIESNYCATQGAPHCIDARVSRFQACPEGLTRIFLQGQCPRAYQVEHTYCAAR